MLAAKIAKWQMPDDVVFVDALPMTATGKISKKDLRAKFADYKLPSEVSDPPGLTPWPLVPHFRGNCAMLGHV